MQSQTDGQDRRTGKRWVAFHFIVGFKKKHDGNSPSLREIAAACGITAPSAALHHVRELAADGVIHLKAGRYGKQRIEVVGGRWTYENPEESNVQP